MNSEAQRGAGLADTDAQSAREAQRKSEARLRQIQEAARIGTFEFDRAANRASASPEYLELYGLSPAALDSFDYAAWLALVHPEDRDRIEAETRAAVADPACHRLDYDFRIRRADTGETRWITARTKLERDGAGRFVRSLGAQWDVTDERRALAALQESESRFRNMADHAPVMMWMSDPSGRCTYLNQHWYEFTGATEEQALGLGWMDMLHPEDRARLERKFGQENEQPRAYRVEFRMRRADGAYRWVIDAASPRFGSDGEFLGFIGSVIDIDERRESEERLALSEERLRLATEAADIGLWDVDVLNDVLFWPPRVKAMFGISPEMPVSMADFYSGLHPDDRERTGAAFAAACDPARRALYDVEYRTVGKDDGLIRWVAAKGRGIFDAGGRCVRVIGTAIDITDRKRTEAALAESEARLRTLTDNLPAALVYQLETSRDLSERRYTYVSGNCEALTGVPLNEGLADPFAFLSKVEPEDAAALFENEEIAARQLTMLEAELRARKPDGRQVALHVYSKPREATDGKLLWDGLLLDVTDLRQTERALRRQAEELRTVFDAVPAGIWITHDPCAREITGNARSYELLRLEPGTNQSKSDPGTPTDHFRFLDNEGQELRPEELPVQRAARGQEVRDYEYRVAFDDGSHVDIFGNAIPLRDGDGGLLGAVAAFVDITARKRWEEHQRLLVNELNHRVKNTLASVQSIASQSLRGAATPEEARRAVEARLQALARAHDVLTLQNWESASLHDIVARAVEPYGNARENRLHIRGPAVRVRPRMALSLAMALHELATNAAKYGALSNESGQVIISWSAHGAAQPAHLRLEWKESGGPPVQQPSRRGFGSRLLERSLAQELDGEVTIDFRADGVVCTISAPTTA